MAVIQPYFTPDSSVGQSVFAVGWNSFLKQRTAMNYKIMDQMLRQADPSYLFKQIEIIDQNILEYEKLKNNLATKGSRAAMEFAQAQANDVKTNAQMQLSAAKSSMSGKSSSSDQDDYAQVLDLAKDVTFNEAEAYGQIIKTAFQAGIKEKGIYDWQTQRVSPSVAVERFSDNMRREFDVAKKAEDPNAYNALIYALDKYLNKDESTPSILLNEIIRDFKKGDTPTSTLGSELDPTVAAEFDKAIRSELRKLVNSDESKFESISDASIDALEAISKKKGSTTPGKKVTAPKIDTAKYFESLEDFGDLIEDYETKIADLKKQRGSLQTEASARMEDFQNRSPFEPFKRNYMTENPFRYNPYEEFLDQQQAMIPNIPGIQFNESYDVGNGFQAGLTTKNGTPVAFLRDQSGQETIYQSGDDLYNTMLSALQEVGKKQQELVAQ